MIGERYIKEWAATHPWRRAEQVEQKMGLSRGLPLPSSYSTRRVFGIMSA